MSEQRGRTYDPECETLARKFLAHYPDATHEDRQELAQRLQDTIEDYVLKFQPGRG